MLRYVALGLLAIHACANVAELASLKKNMHLYR